MSCSNCMKHRPDNVLRQDKSFECPECGQKYKVASVGPGNYYESYGNMTPDPALKGISDKRFIAEENRRNRIWSLRVKIDQLQLKDRELSTLTGEQLLIEINHRKTAKEGAFKK